MRRQINADPWPSLLLNARLELLDCNPLATRVLGLDPAVTHPPGSRRNLLRLLTSRARRDRFLNLNEVLAAVVGVLKAQAQATESTAAYVQTMLQQIGHEDAELGARLLHLWRHEAPAAERVRITWPLRWRAEDGSVLSFVAILSDWVILDERYVNDWRPANASTWAWLDARR